jgi:hypothetical protein
MRATSSKNPVDHLPVFVGAVLLSGVGNLMYEIASQFSYMMGTTYGYGEGSQGDFTAAFFTGYTLVAVSMVFWIRRVNWRLIALGASLLSGISFLLLILLHGYAEIFCTMFCAGVGLGANYALTLTVFGDSDNPERGYGIKFFFDVLPGMAMNLLMPSIFATQGFRGIAVAMILWCALGAGSAALLPSQGSKRRSQTMARFSLRSEGLALLACLSCFMLLIGVMALWAFLGQIGAYKGFPIKSLGTMLAAGSALNAAGALVAAGLGNRFGRLAPVAVTIAMNIVMLVLIGVTTSFVPYAIGALVFCLTNNYTLAYTMGMVANFDQQGRFVPFASACFSAGAIFGPLLAGHILEQRGLGAMLALPAIAWLAALYAFYICCRLDQRRRGSFANTGSAFNVPPTV